MLDLIWELVTGAQEIVSVLFLHKEAKKNKEIVYEWTEIIKGLKRFSTVVDFSELENVCHTNRA